MASWSMAVDPIRHISHFNLVIFWTMVIVYGVFQTLRDLESSDCNESWTLHFLLQEKLNRLRISNVGLQHSLNFRIQGHKMKLVEVEGTHTLQTTYSSLDVHVGQSYSVLVTADQTAQDYYIAVSTRFTTKILTTTAILHYSNSAKKVSGPIPGGPTTEIDWSLNQARSIRRVPCNSLLIPDIATDLTMFHISSE